MLVEITDRTDTARRAVVDPTLVLPVVAGWMAADGCAGESTKIVDSLVAALRAGDWSAVHRIADELLFDVEVAL